MRFTVLLTAFLLSSIHAMPVPGWLVGIFAAAMIMDVTEWFKKMLEK